MNTIWGFEKILLFCFIMKLKFSLCYSLLFLLFFFNASSGYAASFPRVDSAIQPRKPHKLNQQQFLDRYGTDDSSRALIRYYFPRHQTNAVLAVYSGGAMVLAGALAAFVLLTTNFDLLTFLIVVALGAAAYVAALLFVITGIFLLINSRRRLYKFIQNYHNGKGLPRRIGRKKTFLRLLKQEQLRN